MQLVTKYRQREECDRRGVHWHKVLVLHLANGYMGVAFIILYFFTTYAKYSLNVLKENIMCLKNYEIVDEKNNFNQQMLSASLNILRYFLIPQYKIGEQ